MTVIRIETTTAVGVYRVYESDGASSAVRVTTIREPVPSPETPEEAAE